MSLNFSQKLSRRERQIMDIVYEKGECSVTDVLNAMPDPPSYSSIRALMRILEEKGHLKHRQAGLQYIFSPTQPQHSAGRSAIQQVIQTFFGGSAEKAVATLLSDGEVQLSDEELDRLSTLIDQAKQEGR
jgi:predicted transcriptional regulator